MKYFDIVSKKDEVVGKMTAKLCHADPSLIHRVVHFTLVDPKTKNVLITQRSFDVKFDSGKWCFMGEHVLSGDSYENALKRGVKDELGLEVKKYDELGSNIFSYATQTELVRFFLVNWDGSEIKPNSNEVINIKWLSINELKENKHDYSSMTKYWIETYF